MTPETIDLPDQIDEATKKAIADTAKAQADKFVRKNRKEIRRLKAHAEKALLTNDFEAYKYAISKLRTMLRQKTTDELVKALWDSNRQVLFNILTTEVEG
ncbi:hypothetical protein MYO4S_00031 [Serratia phage 4S]|nr:hypothetical protein MYO4S_00031 [Serratia phage 4S]